MPDPPAKAKDERRTYDRPVLIVALVLLVPAYGIFLYFAVREMFDPGSPQKVVVAIWAFIGVLLTSAVTLVGTLLVRAQNLRTLAQQDELDLRRHELAQRQLDHTERIDVLRTDLDARKQQIEREAEERLRIEAVGRSLQLLTVEGGNYATAAQVSGAIATLIELGRCAVALSTLRSAWAEQKIDTEAAVQLVNTIMEMSATDDALAPLAADAAALIRRHAGTLAAGAGPDDLAWPRAAWQCWPAYLPLEGRYDLIRAAFEAVLSRPRSWWGERWIWLIGFLDDARGDPDQYVPEFAWALLNAVLEQLPGDLEMPWADGVLSTRRVRADQRAFAPKRDTGNDREVRDRTDRLRAWAAGQPAAAADG